MAKPPAREFGKRKPVGPVAAEAAPPVKRSRHVALLLMGTFAMGGGAYALMPGENCEPKSPAMAAPSLPQTSTECSPRGSSSSGGHGGGSGGSWSRGNFFGGDSSSGSSSSGTASESASGGVTRGGFGSFARAFASHFSGGG
jgi:hypothetical protein